MILNSYVVLSLSARLRQSLLTCWNLWRRLLIGSRSAREWLARDVLVDIGIAPSKSHHKERTAPNDK